MDLDDLASAATPEHLAAALEKYKDNLALLHHSHGSRPSIREKSYKGRLIRVETTYRITIDDMPVTGHLALSNEGTVHYHAIPNQEFASMVEMVERVIDLSDDLGQLQPAEHGHGGHHHGGKQ
jgi:hypothetical protein